LKVLAWCSEEGKVDCGCDGWEAAGVVSAEKRRIKPPQSPETEELRKVEEPAEVPVGVPAPDDVGEPVKEPEPGLRDDGCGEWELS
jgi:hypothetical protein